ncbi:MAG: AraC family transcriptional regulator [Mesorhizobium sp.]|uniref:helix-turn-helix transcriptional regulator n=1 Tax=Mesorhizobium sp. TaxID=1871066 RepID=UPI000FE8E8C3|nr:AraC family transcriptional regulator [Mesorhizobium sp.]RWI50294.1 MAG: AraC family transcriptional regulator [Mesorhizobium sp.]
MAHTTTWNLATMPRDRLVHHWTGGRFEVARRPHTSSVEGKILSDQHLIMVTLKGGARLHTFKTDAGLSYSGRDGAGTASFLPAGCERRLELTDVAWEWGAIALHTDTATKDLQALPPFIGSEPFIFGLMSQMRSLFENDGALDATYCSVMTTALTEFLTRRSALSENPKSGSCRLTPLQLRNTLDRIECLLSGPIRISDLSGPLDLSEGHFYRAFRGATGRSPLQVISERRVERAAILLSRTNRSINEIAFDVGFASPSHLARTFRGILDASPSTYRREFRAVTNKNDHKQTISSGSDARTQSDKH